MKKIIIIALSLMALMSCEMDFYRSDTMTSSQLKDNPAAAVYTTDGNYSIFRGPDGGNTYIRHYMQMAEFRGDNILISATTTDDFLQCYLYIDTPQLGKLTSFWEYAYKIIYGANANIGSMPKPEDCTVDERHLLGENYFMRAIVHHHLSNLYSRPYAVGNVQRRDNPGVVLRTSTDSEQTTRATVGQVHDQIVEDLLMAAALMKDGKPRGNKGYISYDAARALLTRIYLYMGEDQKVIDLATELLGKTPAEAAAFLDPDVKNYFANALTSKETLWCIGHTVNENQGQSSIGSMYYMEPGKDTEYWGEIYYSDPLIELFNRYPNDLRFKSYYSQFAPLNDNTVMVYWPTVDEDFRSNVIIHDVTDNGNGSYTFSYDGKSYTTKSLMRSKEKVYYIEGYASDSEDLDDVENGTRVYIRPNVEEVAGTRNKKYPKFLCSKFGFQDGIGTLSSPVMIRWAEVVLNLAEAHAHLGNDKLALDYVNVIRNRAQIPAITLETMAENGYDNVLDVVLDERRMEFTHEGFRALDLYRNNKPIDRRYAGFHDWKVWSVDELEKYYHYSIPYSEITVSGIKQNDNR